MSSLPFSSQTRPALPSRITTSAAKLPKVPPGSTRFALSTISCPISVSVCASTIAVSLFTPPHLRMPRRLRYRRLFEVIFIDTLELVDPNCSYAYPAINEHLREICALDQNNLLCNLCSKLVRPRSKRRCGDEDPFSGVVDVEASCEGLYVWTSHGVPGGIAFRLNI